ncbi:MAG: hypothetical protein IJV70_04835 [Clostridia bacterium]|nr:hypothetical protein [Clostridia bacterium]
MFTIDIVVQKKPGLIELGVQGENAAKAAVFDVTPWVEEYGTGTAYIYHQRLSDAAPYFKELPIVTSDGRSTATWTFDAADTGVKGEGAAQLLFVKDDVIKKTAIYVTVTGRSIGEAGGDVPDPYEDLIQAVREVYQLIVNEREATQRAAGNAHESETAAASAAEDASESAEDAATSAQIAGNTFSVAGNVTFPVDPNTGAVYAVFNEEE